MSTSGKTVKPLLKHDQTIPDDWFPSSKYSKHVPTWRIFDRSPFKLQPPQQVVIVIGVISGLLGGLLAGGGVMTIFSSGTKAILMCWAEEPNRLHEEHEFEDLHTEPWICTISP